MNKDSDMQSARDRANSQSIRPSDPEQSFWSKSLEVALNPMTAAGYVARGKDLPDNFSRGPRNALDHATDLVNPAQYVHDTKNVVQGAATADGMQFLEGAAGLAPVPLLAKGVKSGAKNLAKSLKTNPSLINVPNIRKTSLRGNKAKRPFKSEIDWRNWNKEITGNKVLKKEYDAIEKQHKDSNTWMKYSDGSKFEGSPEQFVQMNSKNLEKFAGSKKEAEIMYKNALFHGSPTKGIDKFDISKARRLTSGDKYTDLIFTSTNKDVASEYAGSSGEILELIGSKGKNKSVDYKGEAWTGLKPGYVVGSNNREGMNYDEFGNILNNSTKKFKNKKNAQKHLDNMEDAPYKGDMIVKKNNFLDLEAGKNSPLSTNKLADRYREQGFDSFTAKNVVDPFDGTNTNKLNEIGDDVVFFKGDNRLKSIKGNNGMFDMSNPNIYKALFPAAGAGAVMSSQSNEFKKGGKLDPTDPPGPKEEEKPFSVTKQNHLSSPTVKEEMIIPDVRDQYRTQAEFPDFKQGEDVNFSKAVKGSGAQAFLNRYNHAITRKRMMEQSGVSNENIDNMILKGLSAKKHIGGNTKGSKASYSNDTVHMGEDYKDNHNVETHERVHASGIDGAMGIALTDVLGNAFHQEGKEWLKKTSPSTLDYLNQPHEAYGNFSEFRSALGMKPGDKIDKKKLERLVKEKGLGMENFYRAYNTDKIVKALNTIAYQESNNNEYKLS